MTLTVAEKEVLDDWLTHDQLLVSLKKFIKSREMLKKEEVFNGDGFYDSEG